MKLLITGAAAVALVSAASAQNYNAFKQMDGFNDVSITQSGNSFTVSLGADPTVTRSGKTHDIKEVIGFWLLGASGDVNGSLAAKSGWDIKTNTGGGRSAYGWQTENKNGIHANQSETFTFNNFNLSQVTEYGLKLHADGVPAHVKFPAGKQTVPEPMSLFALATGGAMLLKRKRKA
jgi:predicted transport protein